MALDIVNRIMIRRETGVLRRWRIVKDVKAFVVVRASLLRTVIPAKARKVKIRLKIGAQIATFRHHGGNSR
jgi:hypothetical protein